MTSVTIQLDRIAWRDGRAPVDRPRIPARAGGLLDKRGAEAPACRGKLGPRTGLSGFPDAAGALGGRAEHREKIRGSGWQDREGTGRKEPGGRKEAGEAPTENGSVSRFISGRFAPSTAPAPASPAPSRRTGRGPRGAITPAAPAMDETDAPSPDGRQRCLLKCAPRTPPSSTPPDAQRLLARKLPARKPLQEIRRAGRRALRAVRPSSDAWRRTWNGPACGP